MNESKKYIMAFDQGTTSCRCIIFDRGGDAVSAAQQEFSQSFPRAGWVEHDPMEIWETQLSVAREAMRKRSIPPDSIAALGITNQRETTVMWDRDTGEPLCNAIVWQCRRTAEYCEKLKDSGYEAMVKDRTGLLIDPYFSASKIHWILENVPNARSMAESGKTLFGTIDSWLIWKLTKGRAHVTDVSNASRTMLFNIRELKWDSALLDVFEIPDRILPDVIPSGHVCGYADAEHLGAELPIAAAIGDQQASLFGLCCFPAGSAKCTYGTGCFVLMNTGSKIDVSGSNLLSTIAWRTGGRTEYALEGSVFSAGSVVQWLRDGLGVIGSSPESESLALSVPDANGVYFVPAFTGLGAPWWEPRATGTISGLTRSAGREHIVRAALESIAFQTADVLRAMSKDSKCEIDSLRVDGGAAENRFLLQFQADILGVPIEKSSRLESTAFGAAAMAGLAAGYFESKDELYACLGENEIIYPAIGESERESRVSGWHRAVGSVLAAAEK
ncbi:MAG: glycerol kinase GlpK [Clostridiales Family XIII bacterium]|jgi:glycerol kinase|nr:glycerol kinase GlpK [Clostridiales Family XIII bacterium]